MHFGFLFCVWIVARGAGKPAKRQHEELDKSEPEDTADATPAPAQVVAPPPAKRRRPPKKSPAKVRLVFILIIIPSMACRNFAFGA